MNYIRIHAIPTDNDDGSKPNIVTADKIARSIDYANNVYKNAGIIFVFDPQTDLDPIRRNTRLNVDMLEVPNPNLNAPEDSCPGNTILPDAEKDRIAHEYPGKLVLFYGSADGYHWDQPTKRWNYKPGPNWSNSFHWFVRLVASDDAKEKVAHEIGHYLQIGHTFGSQPTSKSQACDLIREYVIDKGHPKEEGLKVFDGDYPYVSDTPPDMGIDIFKEDHLNPCHDVITLSVDLKKDGKDLVQYTFTPDRFNNCFNIMSYFGCTQTTQGLLHYISKQQANRIREALEKGNRYHLIAPRVLYDVVWEWPSLPNPRQTRVLGWGLIDFAARFDKELALNRYISLMQAYDIGGGQIRWNGVWEPGNTAKTQTRAICWTYKDFADRFKRELDNGMNLVHMQAYSIEGGQICWDGIWEKGDSGQTWVLGWSLNNFAKRFNEEIAKGRHAFHVQAYDIGGGEIRWDGVWEKGDKGQTRALCWSLNDFAKRFDEEIAKGRHASHIQAYNTGAGPTSWDGIWENGDRGQTWALGWSLNDFIKRSNDEIANGRHASHIQSYEIETGQICWDGIWEAECTGQTKALGLSLGDITVILDNKLAGNEKIVHMQAYLRRQGSFPA